MRPKFPKMLPWLAKSAGVPIERAEELWADAIRYATSETGWVETPEYWKVAVDRLLAKEKALGANLKFEDIIEEVAGVYPRIMLKGDMDAGAWSCGMVAGLIYDIPTVKELIDRIMTEADDIIHRRLNGLY